MIYTPLLVNLAVAAGTAYLSLNTSEEIVKVASAFVAILSSFLSLLFVPWPVKILILVLPLVVGKLRRDRNLSGEMES